jgi:hypothetical protein
MASIAHARLQIISCVDINVLDVFSSKPTVVNVFCTCFAYRTAKSCSIVISVDSIYNSVIEDLQIHFASKTWLSDFDI